MRKHVNSVLSLIRIFNKMLNHDGENNEPPRVVKSLPSFIHVGSRTVSGRTVFGQFYFRCLRRVPPIQWRNRRRIDGERESAHVILLWPHSRLGNINSSNTGSDATQRRYVMWNSIEWTCERGEGDVFHIQQPCDWQERRSRATGPRHTM